MTATQANATVTTTTVAVALRRAVVRATLAPSVHNTQPWRFVLSGDVLEIYADPARRLHVLDPAGRQMLISCGCALFNARVSMAASGLHAEVERMPHASQPNLLARVRAVAVPARLGPGPDILAMLDASISSRRTNRRRFDDERSRAGSSTRSSVPRPRRGLNSSRSPGRRTGSPWPSKANAPTRRKTPIRSTARSCGPGPLATPPVMTAYPPRPSRMARPAGTTTFRCATTTPLARASCPPRRVPG